MKHILFALGTVLMLSPGLAVKAQTTANEAHFSSQHYGQHESSTQTSESIESGFVVHTDRERRDRRERSQITSDLLNYSTGQPPRILVRCRQESFLNGRSESLSEGPQSEHTSSHSAIRELLSNRAEQATIIEIHGNCHDIRIQIEAAQQQAAPHSRHLDPLQSHLYPIWNEELSQDDWLTRTGSGWDWFLRRSVTPLTPNH